MSTKKVEIIEVVVCAEEEVYICGSTPTKLRVSEFVGYLKGKSALMIFDKHPEQASK
jgi:putative transposase